MANTPLQRGKGYQVRWKHRGTRAWQSTTISKFDTDKRNLDAAWALWNWLRERNDAVLASDPAILQYAFLRPGQPLHSTPSTAPTFGKLGEELITLKTHVTENTRARWRGRLTNHFADWQDKPVDEITEADVATKAMTLQGYANGNSYNILCSTMKAILRRAVDEEHIRKNPARNLVVRQAVQAELDIMTRDEFALLFSSCVCSQTQDMMRFMIQTGCRIGEVLGLQVSDFRLAAGQPDVFIRRSLGQDRQLGLPKGRKTRAIPLDPSTAAYFGELIADRKKAEFVFQFEDGGAWPYTDWRRKCWLPTVQAAIDRGFDQDRISIRPHGLRHTHASWLLAAGVDIRVLSKRLGHADPAMTLRKYIHTTRQGDEVLNNALVRLASCTSLA